jgi:hypothetical protein
MTEALLAVVVSASLLAGAAAGYWQGWRDAIAAAGRARARHNAEENRRRTEQEQQLAAMNRDQRRAAQVAAREVSRKGGRTKRGRS